MDGAYKYRAFISYSHSDNRWGEWLHRALETYRLPKKIVGKDTPYGPIPRRLTPIFRDRDELATADDLSEEISTALEASQFLIVICSPAAAGSRWVNEEIKSFKGIHGEGRVRALIVDGEPFSDDAKKECFPEALRFKFDDNGQRTSEPAEPIAADLRPGGDGKKYALSKLVAGLTGAKLDELIQREEHRRGQRMRAVAGIFGVVAAGMGALAVNAVIARNEAQVQRTAAITARDDAENLIEFMLTDLRDRLDAVGRLDILDSVGERALVYYEARDLDAADPDALGRRARAQLLVGEIDNLRGDLDAALEAYEAAAATTEEQLRRDPDNAQRIFDHSQSVFWVGYIAWQRGDADTARGYFTQYYDQAKRLVKIDSDNDDYQAELMYAYSNLGTLEMDEGNAAQAEAHFRPALEISMTIFTKNPDDIDLMLEVGQSYAWLADALHRQSKLREARNTRHAELLHYNRGRGARNDNAALKQAISVAHYRLAQIEIAAGYLTDALGQSETAVRGADQLLALEPESLQQADRASLAYAVLGEVNFHLGRHNDARKSLSKSIELAERLVARDESVALWAGFNFAQPKITLARVEAATGNRALALKLFGTVANDLRALIARDSVEIPVISLYCEAIAGQARSLPGQSDFWTEIESILVENREKLGPGTMSVLAEAYVMTGKKTKAAAIASQLYAAGYRHPDFLALLAANPDLLPDPARTTKEG